MTSAAFFLVGVAVGCVAGCLITLAHTEFEPATNRLFVKWRARSSKTEDQEAK